MNSRIKLIALSISLLCASQAPIAYAGEEEAFDDSLEDFYGDEEFVSIATGSKKLIYKAPSVSTVITRDDIEMLGVTDLDDLLETVPGLHISRSPNSYSSIYVFRGVYSRFNPQVLMLVNGIPITNMFVGNRSQIWGGMGLSMVERVEVIRGPGSAIYGAEAFVGVINIITRNSETIEGNEIGARYGSYNTRDFWIAFKEKLGEVDASFVLEKHVSDGNDNIIEADAQTFLDAVFGTDASYAPFSLDNERDNLDLRAEFSFENWRYRIGLQSQTVGLAVGIADAFYPENQESSDRWNMDLSYTKSELDINKDWGVEVIASYFDTTQEIDGNLYIFPPGANIGFGVYPNGIIGNPEVFERHTRLGSTFTFNGFEEHELRIGIGYNLSDLYEVKESKNFALGPDGLPLDGSEVVDVTDTPYVFTQEGDRENKYIFVQDIWKLANDWELTAGVRYDDYSDFGSTTNPRLALVWSSSLNLTTKLLYGQAFRAPSVAETRNINNPVALGNPNLKPEEIETLELAFEYHPQSAFRATTSLFINEWTNIIQFVPDGGSPSNTAQNVGEQESYGVEFDFSWKASENLKLSGNFAFQKSTDKLTDSDAPYVPQKQVYVRADWKLSNDWSLSLKGNRIMDRERAIGDPRAPIDDYSLIDASVHWKSIESDWDVSIMIRNLLDEDAREPTLNANNLPNDLPLPDSNALIQVSYHY